MTDDHWATLEWREQRFIKSGELGAVRVHFGHKNVNERVSVTSVASNVTLLGLS